MAAACVDTSDQITPLVGGGSVGGRDKVSVRGGEGVAGGVTLSDETGKEPGALSETTSAVEGAGKASVV